MARIKGLETTSSFTSPNGPVKGIEDVLDFEYELDIEILEAEYLGHESKSYDEIYNGVSGNITLHMSGKEMFEFEELIENRARRRSAASGVFTHQSTYNFPDGGRVRLTFEDIHFGPIQTRSQSRKDYVQKTFSWKCETVRRTF